MSFVWKNHHHKNDKIVHSSAIDNSGNQSISNKEFSYSSTIFESSPSELDQSYIISSNSTLIQYFWYYYYQSKLFLRRLFASSFTKTLVSLIAIPFISGFITALIRNRHQISTYKH